MPKYNNFKVIPPAGSTYTYISKCGHPSNSGTDPNYPRLPYQLNNGTYVFGAGHYVGTGNINTVNNTINMIADGKVIIEGYSWDRAFVGQIQGITFVNIKNGISFRQNYASGGNCKFINTGLFARVNDAGLPSNCVFIRCQLMDEGGLAVFFNKSVIQGMTNAKSVPVRFADCDVDANSVVLFPDNSYITRSNYRGILRMPCADGVFRDYAVKDLHVGTPQQAGYPDGVKWLSQAALAADGATNTRTDWDALLANCLNRPPKFANEAGEDFTYQSDSPNLRRAGDGTNIGGQEVSSSVSNADNGNAAGTRIEANAAIDTAVPEAYQLKTGETGGYVDYMFYNGGLTINKLDLMDVFNFNSDVTPGQPGNRNVPDAEPVTAQYPFFVKTTLATAALNQLTVPAGKIAAGQHVRVLGEPCQVLSKAASGTNDVLTLSTSLRAAVGAGVEVTYGSELQLAAINPNRLTVFMRTRSSAEAPSWPMINSDWDNGIDAIYNKIGWLFNQEIGAKPVIILDGTQAYGGGDSDAPTGIPANEMAPEWIHVRVYKRNNYNAKGLPA